MPMYERPPFWRVPHQRRDPENESRDFGQRRHVTQGTPAGRELVRGDIIAKIDDYDARDLRHEDAQNLFRNAPQQIKLVVQRTPSPQQGWRGQESQQSWRGPESLPRTPIPPHGPAGPAGLPHYSPYPQQIEGEYRTLLLSPSSIRTDDTLDESIQSQPYRTTPLVLPGAKVRREPGPTESYLRHHPNPAMRAPPSHDYRDTLMRQKVSHKQFNSPIHLYSEQNIANSIRQQTSPLPANGYYGRPHVVKSTKRPYDPATSHAYRALQEEGLGDVLQEVTTPATTKVFTAPLNKKPTPIPRPQPEEKPKGKQPSFVNSLHEEHIQQSNSFKRLMYHVLGDTDF